MLAACGGGDTATTDQAKSATTPPTEGRWLAKVRTGEATFIEDTLDLRGGGTGNAHRLEYTLRQIDGGGIDSSVVDFGAKQITWTVTDGNLCVAGQSGPEANCGPLNVVSDSVFNLGNFVYQLLERAPARQP